MALIICKNCGKHISDKASQCIHCGNSILKDDTMNNKKQVQNNEIELLKKELEAEKIKSSNLQKKLDNKKKEQRKKTSKKTKKNIRYYIAIFCGIGSIACLTDGKIFYAIGYLIIGISFIPFIYNVFKKNEKLLNTLQIAIPIIAFIIGSIISTFEK